MVEANHPGHLPRSVFFLLLPELNELCFADRLGRLVTRMVKAVHPNLHGAIVGNRVHLERPGHELASHFAADVVLDGLNECRASPAQAGLIVIELEIVGEQRSEFLEIAMVVGVENWVSRDWMVWKSGSGVAGVWA